jgi:hypothetical protein
MGNTTGWIIAGALGFVVLCQIFFKLMVRPKVEGQFESINQKTLKKKILAVIVLVLLVCLFSVGYSVLNTPSLSQKFEAIPFWAWVMLVGIVVAGFSIMAAETYNLRGTIIGAAAGLTALAIIILGGHWLWAWLMSPWHGPLPGDVGLHVATVQPLAPVSAPPPAAPQPIYRTPECTKEHHCPFVYTTTGKDNIIPIPRLTYAYQGGTRDGWAACFEDSVGNNLVTSQQVSIGLFWEGAAIGFASDLSSKDQPVKTDSFVIARNRDYPTFDDGFYWFVERPEGGVVSCE